MIEELRQRLAGLLPLTISAASYEDPTLTVAGEGWSMSTMSSWRVLRSGVLVFGWSDESAPVRVGDLVGQQIVSVAAQSPRMAGDPAFELSNGEWLEIFSDHPIDPWALALPGIVFVGSPSDPEFTR